MKTIHLRFAQGTVFCTAYYGRPDMPEGYRHGQGFRCPGCGARVPALPRPAAVEQAR